MGPLLMAFTALTLLIAALLAPAVGGGALGVHWLHVILLSLAAFAYLNFSGLGGSSRRAR